MEIAPVSSMIEMAKQLNHSNGSVQFKEIESHIKQASDSDKGNYLDKTV